VSTSVINGEGGDFRIAKVATSPNLFVALVKIVGALSVAAADAVLKFRIVFNLKLIFTGLLDRDLFAVG